MWLGFKSCPIKEWQMYHRFSLRAGHNVLLVIIFNNNTVEWALGLLYRSQGRSFNSLSSDNVCNFRPLKWCVNQTSREKRKAVIDHIYIFYHKYYMKKIKKIELQKDKIKSSLGAMYFAMYRFAKAMRVTIFFRTNCIEINI